MQICDGGQGDLVRGIFSCNFGFCVIYYLNHHRRRASIASGENLVKKLGFSVEKTRYVTPSDIQRRILREIYRLVVVQC